MKSIIALGVGLVVALAPGGTAFAAVADNATGKGNAYGNCGHSSANGVNDPRLDGGAGNGNGGHVAVAKEFEGCVVPDDESAEAPATGGTLVGDSVTSADGAS